MKNNNIDFNSLEILSPAGSRESFFAAINNGCDAIYLGLSSFNARMRAENFTTENIREFIKIAHSYGVKIYITINTLILDEEFDDLTQLVQKLTEAKADAFIVQDFGVAHVLKTCFPNICLHASTQMGIHNLEGARFAEKLGFSRIVLSRETKLTDIKQIRDNTNLEIEYFVQGALCVAFSGNCYLSSIENGASGNEGKCLQLCRLPYKNNLTGEEKYYLSTHDLCLLKNLKTLINAGVTSFKIEGRLRHPGYVASATNAFKSAIKKLQTNSLSENFILEQIDYLRETFSRGKFNEDAYLSPGTPDDTIYKDYQNHIGKKIGTVVSVKPFKENLFKATITSSAELHSGDGLKIIDENKKVQVASLGIGNVNQIKTNTYEIVTKNKFFAGNSVFLTQNANYEQKLLKNDRKIKINAKIIANANENLIIILSANNTKITYSSSFILEKAKNQPTSKEDILSQIGKLGDTIFAINNAEIQTNGVFIPKSLLNEARRNAITLLQNKIIEENEKLLIAKFDENKFLSLKNVKNSVISKNLYIIDENFNDFDKTKTYIFAPCYYNNQTASKFNEISKEYDIALSVPTLLFYEDMQVFKEFLNKLNQKPTLFANNIGALNFVELGYNIIASPLLNIKNNYAIKCLNSQNITFICSSIEADEHFIKENNLTAFSSGLFPLMTFAHCPYKTVFDETCSFCKFNGKLKYTGSKDTYPISRTKLAGCQFQLNKYLNKNINNCGLFNLKNI